MKRATLVAISAGLLLAGCSSRGPSTSDVHAAASARAKAANEAAYAARLAAEEQLCPKLGGVWSRPFFEPGCVVDYRNVSDGSTEHFIVTFDEVGTTVVPDPRGPQTARECATYFGDGIKGYWHADTYACTS